MAEINKKKGKRALPAILLGGAIALGGFLLLKKKASAEPLPPAGPTGEVSPGVIRYEGLLDWEEIVSGREIPIGTDIFVVPYWSNTSSIDIVGHVRLVITYKGLDLEAVANWQQDMTASPDQGFFVGFAPFRTATEPGVYTLKIELSTEGKVLDSKTFTLKTVAKVATITLKLVGQPNLLSLPAGFAYNKYFVYYVSMVSGSSRAQLLLYEGNSLPDTLEISYEALRAEFDRWQDGDPEIATSKFMLLCNVYGYWMYDVYVWSPYFVPQADRFITWSLATGQFQ